MSKNVHGTMGLKASSLSHDPEADADWDYAVRLHAEMNGEDLDTPLGSPLSQSYLEKAEYDADFALAVQIQSSDSAEAQAAKNSTYSSPSAANSVRKTTTPPTPGSSLWEVPNWNVRLDSSIYGDELDSQPPGMSFDTLTDLTTYLKGKECAKCGGLLVPSADSVTEILDKWKQEGAPLTSHLTCSNCSLSACVACGSNDLVGDSYIEVKNRTITWCCSGGRLFLLWIIHCAFDHRDHAAKPKESFKTITRSMPCLAKKDSAPGHPSRGNKKIKMLPKDNGVGFGGTSTIDDGSGFDFLDELFEATQEYQQMIFSSKRSRRSAEPTQNADKVRAQKAQNAEDSYNEFILKFVANLLPIAGRGSNFEINPPGAISNMLLESKILGYCAELLRNDSLEDAAKRHELYSTMLAFLDAICHRSTADVFYNERPVRPGQANILAFSFRNHAGIPTETAPSLFEGLQKLATQSKLLLQGSRAHAKDFGNTDGQTLLSLCRRILNLSRFLEANHASRTGQTVDQKNHSAIGSITDVPHQDFVATYAFVKAAKAVRTVQPGRMKRLITEITTLNAGLPPGIFVRYLADRPDMLKAIIIGPVGTPYENGMFEFDFFCGPTYPSDPPSVLFKTTGGGRAAFNPNLYRCGKVCLSLLGTWQGQPWKPGESTLLQVLISLQAMVLCEEPWFNEPGREQKRGTTGMDDVSTSYNQRIYKLMVRYAMLDWIKDPPKLWKEVVAQHFKQNGNHILEVASQWATAKKPTNLSSRYAAEMDYADLDMAGMIETGSNTPDMNKTLPELQTALRKYGATYVVPKIPIVRQPENKRPAPRTSVLGSLLSTFSGPAPAYPPAPPPVSSAYPGPRSGFSSFGMPDPLLSPYTRQPASSMQYAPPSMMQSLPQGMLQPTPGGIPPAHPYESVFGSYSNHLYPPQHPSSGRGRGGSVSRGRGGYDAFGHVGEGQGGHTAANAGAPRALRWDLPPLTQTETNANPSGRGGHAAANAPAPRVTRWDMAPPAQTETNANTKQHGNGLQVRTRGDLAGGRGGRGDRGGLGRGGLPRGGRGH